jgi:hypothetical protein
MAIPDLMNRGDLLQTALHCGGLYALWRIVLTVCYPLVSGSLWQNVIGPQVIRRYPQLGQSEDISRPSYLPTQPDQAFVIAHGLLSVTIEDLTNGIRDGILIGVLYALLPEFMQPGFLTFLLAIVLLKGVWRVYSAEGSVATDKAICAGHEILMYVGAILALQSTQHFLH